MPTAGGYSACAGQPGTGIGSIRTIMERKHIAIFVWLLIVAVACAGQDQNAPSAYSSLLARVKDGDVSIDFKQLRFSYMESAERRQAKDTDEQKRDMFKSLNAKDSKKAVADADAVLAGEYVDMDAHFVEYIAYRELNESAKSNFHKSVFQGLLKSITDSGDGKSAETAYVVISVHEEYVVLQVLGLKPSNQSVLHQGGHSYDVLETKHADSNATVKLYFNVDIPFKHYMD